MMERERGACITAVHYETEKLYEKKDWEAAELAHLQASAMARCCCTRIALMSG